MDGEYNALRRRTCRAASRTVLCDLAHKNPCTRTADRAKANHPYGVGQHFSHGRQCLDDPGGAAGLQFRRAALHAGVDEGIFQSVHGARAKMPRGYREVSLPRHRPVADRAGVPSGPRGIQA
jgi:hypothetical protein